MYVFHSITQHRKRASLALVSALALTLSGCATLSKEECLTADWDAIGESDGAAGYASQSRIAGHTKACAKVDIKPDQLAWRAGYDRGLLRYCTPQNGLFVGQKGQTYNNVCPADLSSDFIAAYSVGKRAHDAESELDSLKQDIETKQDEVSELLKDFAGMNQKDQLAAQFEIAELNAEIQRLQADVVQLSTDVARTKAEAEAYRQKLLSGS